MLPASWYAGKQALTPGLPRIATTARTDHWENTARPVERLALNRFASPWLRNQHLARYRFAAGFARGKRVLDLACGAGYGSGLLRQAGARLVVSADRATGAFDEARQPGSGAGELAGTVADASRLPFADRSFDLYVSFETIEHVKDDQAAVEEAHRVLAPGGILLCSTPEREVISPGKSLEDRPDNPHHVREYNRAEFAALLGTRFREIRWRGQTRWPLPLLRPTSQLGSLSPFAGRKLHQLLNVLRLPVEREARHAPYPLDGASGVPEVLLAICER